MDEIIMERYELARDRIREIPEEAAVPEPFRDFFNKEASFLLQTTEILEREKEELSMEEWKQENYSLYADILPEQYGKSYANPEAAVRMLGSYGQMFCFAACELRGAIVYAYEKRWWDMTVLLELFLQLYGEFSDPELPSEQTVKNVLESYISDYAQDMIEYRVREQVDPKLDFARKLIMDSDLSDLRYLYRFGEYISENELRTAEFMNSLPQEEIEAMASTYTEGYRKGFENGRKDLRKKKTVNIRYNLGFERMIRAAVLQFEGMGLESVLFRHAPHAVNRRNQTRGGYTGGYANPQYDYDHRQDSALFLTEEFAANKKRALQNAYEKVKSLAAVHGGPAVVETFGEKPFVPKACAECITFTPEQQKLNLKTDNDSMQIVNRYIPGDERSFTIIAYPLPGIGERYEEIFREIVKINTLDYEKYQKIQQTIIDTLDSCEWVEIKGRNDNETDLLIHLHPLEKPEKQTNFENCLADVNIPLGEVFTTPMMAGTGGLLHVKKVYLSGLEFRDLRLVFDCGQVIEYSCSNFETEEENRKYIEDNILFHHPRIAMGEFAIGTNTTAYVCGRKYGIEDKMPILIAEKTGPHFAVGDTCYSWEEDRAVYNPDGKEIIARDNEISEMRKDYVSLAYFGCHTDITIPYDELGSISVIRDDGDLIPIIEEGRFVLPGTEELNIPLDTMQA